jgi:DNA-binding transcriptional ArsR family regulator
MTDFTTKTQKQRRRATLRPHPARDQIVDVMRSYGRPISPTRLSKITGSTLGSIAYHVRTLVSAGVVELADEGRVRGAVEHFYALTGQDEDTHLADPVGTLLSLCGALTVPADDGGYPCPVDLDDDARQELTNLLKNDFKPQVLAVVKKHHARLAS